MIRMTMFFNTDNYTWTESHWLPGLSGYAAAIQPAINIANARNDLLAEDAFLIAVRLTDTALPRSSYYLSPAQLPGVTSPFQVQINNITLADRPYSCVLVAYTGADGTEARGFVSGAPDRIMGEGLTSTRGLLPLGLWGTKFDTYAGTAIPAAQGVLGFNGAAYRALDYTAPNAQPILNFPTNALAAGEIGVTLAGPLTFTLTPPVIMLKGVRKVNTRLPGLHGQYYVNLNPAVFPVAAPWTYFLAGTENVNPANLVRAQGVAAALKYKYPVIQSGVAYAATHRKRGASALAPRGRSRTRV